MTERLRAHFDEAQLLELAATIAWENYRARFNRAFEVRSSGFSEGAFCAARKRQLHVIGRWKRASPCGWLASPRPHIQWLFLPSLPRAIPTACWAASTTAFGASNGMS